MIRIKKEHLGKRIARGNTTIILSEELSQRELIHIKNFFSPEYVEDYYEEPVVEKKKTTMKEAEKNAEAYIYKEYEAKPSKPSQKKKKKNKK